MRIRVSPSRHYAATGSAPITHPNGRTETASSSRAGRGGSATREEQGRTPLSRRCRLGVLRLLYPHRHTRTYNTTSKMSSI